MKRLGAALALIFVLGLALAQPASADSVERRYVVGDEPWSIAVDPADGRVFVAKTATAPGLIAVIEPVSGEVTQYRTTGTPYYLAVDSVNRRLYVSNHNQTLDVFDLATMTIEATLSAGGTGVAVDPSTRRVYVAGATTLTVIDGTTNTVVASRAALDGESWIGVAHDPALHHLYVTNIFEWTYSPTFSVYRSLVVLDDRDLSVVTELRLPVFPRYALAVDQARHRVYVAGESNTTDPRSLLVAFDGTTLTQVGSAVVPGFPGGIALAPHVIYVTALGLGYTGYHVFDDETLALTRSVSTSFLKPLLPAMHPDGRLYVGLREDGGPDGVAAIGIGNHAPLFRASALSPTNPTTTDVLSVDVDAIDTDWPAVPGIIPDPLTLSYEWARNGVVIAGESGSTLDLSRAGTGDRGDTITVRVTASDPQGLTATVSRSVLIANSAPTAAVTLGVSSPTTNQVVTATTVSSDPDGDALTYAFTWKVNSVVRAVTSGPNASSSFDLSTADNGDRGETVLVEVVATDGTLQSLTASASAVIVNSAPVVTVSLSDATPRSTDVLVAAASPQDADADPTTLTYTWSVNGVVRQTGASNRFDLAVKGNGDNGDVVSVTATASDGTASATASANATVTQKKH